jgi:prepilin-type N-terminal cleavage/methylation domain-containing protein
MKVFSCPRLSALDSRPRTAFTLIEIMIVVGIIGLMAAMGVPSILQSLQKEGMRKAVSDMVDACNDARAHAILGGQPTDVTFHPLDRTFASSGGKSAALPDGIDFAMLDINMMDFSQSDVSRVRFFPNGTCDEMTVVLHSGDDWRKITLEFSTSIATVSAVDK